MSSTQLLQLSYFPRNAFRKSALETAQKVAELIVSINEGDNDISSLAGKKDETYNDARLLWGVVEGPRVNASVTLAGERYLKYYDRNPVAAFEWLAIRSGWLYSMPNSSNGDFSANVRSLGYRVNLLDLLVRTIDLLTRDATTISVLKYSEYITILSRDSAWNWSPYGIYDEIKHLRSNPAKVANIRATLFLRAEDELGLSREALNTPLRKFAIQCGLFMHVGTSEQLGSGDAGLALSDKLMTDRNLRRMYDHILKYPRHDLEEKKVIDDKRKR